jgi:hypothetical protein
MNYFLTQKVKGTTYYFQIMGIYVVLHSRNISNTYITTLPARLRKKDTNTIKKPIETRK